jgi:hypothetical protein
MTRAAGEAVRIDRGGAGRDGGGASAAGRADLVRPGALDPEALVDEFLRLAAQTREAGRAQPPGAR